MKYQLLVLFLAVGLGLSCGGRATSSNLPMNSVKSNVNSNIPINSNISNANLNNTATETTAPANPDILRQIEEQQKEDKRLSEEKLKNAGKSLSNSNAPAKRNVPKGNQQTF